MKQKYIDRFWKRVNVKGKSDCWEWMARTHEGYGMFYSGNVQERAHRISYKLAFGEIPHGKCVCHSCDNPSCVNPNHLWIGTRKDNNIDRDRKGRQIAHPGEKHGMAKLTDEEVKEIRRLYDTGDYTYQTLADQFGVGITMIGYVVSGANWKHLPYTSKYRQGKKLDKQAADMIRELYDTGKYTYKQLGERFGVSKTMAGLIIRNRFWNK